MEKLTKKQTDAISRLLLDIDELDNKPRRLYSALEEFAFAFGKEEAIPAIREAQDALYAHLRDGDRFDVLFRTFRKFSLEEWRLQIEHAPEDTESTTMILAGVARFIKLYVKEMIELKLP